MSSNNEMEQAIVFNYKNRKIDLYFEKNNADNGSGIFWKCFKDEDNECWGEYRDYYNSNKVKLIGFFDNGSPIGMWTYYNEDGSLLCKYFYSFENPVELIDENEYKRQLAKIRFGIWKVPALDLKISDYER